ncbi:hypothetical protein DUNSADRAFT_15907 [Dunaliella salina]|uniref:Encoded protein n=1 Tax=Dunaliella salina TaxID=3046 RepID=A0ABQ7H1C3_DUNSA|nr:hypothetical protein DUNSADRAFT_15907 [Dunaliella salina]|eukprot:KAF5840664.1 hypothetical protein DUNSADRAFT_15907 [Dunaliella salina]
MPACAFSCATAAEAPACSSCEQGAPCGGGSAQAKESSCANLGHRPGDCMYFCMHACFILRNFACSCFFPSLFLANLAHSFRTLSHRYDSPHRLVAMKAYENIQCVSMANLTCAAAHTTTSWSSLTFAKPISVARNARAPTHTSQSHLGNQATTHPSLLSVSSSPCP